MHIINSTNVCDALPNAVRYLMETGKVEQTRVGTAIVAQVPVCIIYRYPKQHVLLNPVRDANPFFHLMEAMWMLAGRDDGAFLDHYIANFSRDFGVDGIIPDAYGKRWRFGLGYDQLGEIVRQLKNNHGTRQCVLQMWGAGRIDLLADVSRPCNLVTTFRITDNRLDMTVFNRSNDLIWGCCGANAVHFAIMQEYVASMVGVEVGMYWQISTNLHLYKTHIDMFRKRIVKDNVFTIDINLAYHLNHGIKAYESTQPLIEFPHYFDNELREVMNCLDDIHKGLEVYDGNIGNSFLRETVLPMATAHQRFKEKRYVEALEEVEKVAAQDWKTAGKEWMERHNGRRHTHQT